MIGSDFFPVLTDAERFKLVKMDGCGCNVRVIILKKTERCC